MDTFQVPVVVEISASVSESVNDLTADPSGDLHRIPALSAPVARPSGTTSLQRTYRYLRLAIAGAVVVVFTAVLVAMPAVGLLPSLSHYYYTPANTMFVGALMAARQG